MGVILRGLSKRVKIPISHVYEEETRPAGRVVLYL